MTPTPPPSDEPIIYSVHDAVYTGGSSVNIADVTPEPGLWLVSASIFDSTDTSSYSDHGKTRVSLSSPSLPYPAANEGRNTITQTPAQVGVVVAAESPITLDVTATKLTAMSVLVRCVRMG